MKKNYFRGCHGSSHKVAIVAEAWTLILALEFLLLHFEMQVRQHCKSEDGIPCRHMIESTIHSVKV